MQRGYFAEQQGRPYVQSSNASQGSFTSGYSDNFA